MADAGRVISIELTPVDYNASGSARAPFRIHATDAQCNYVSLVYFGRNSGWARKLLPLHEKRFISGKLESYGQELQIIHPDYVLPPEEAGDVPEREPVYGLSEGLTNRSAEHTSELQSLMRISYAVFCLTQIQQYQH